MSTNERSSIYNFLDIWNLPSNMEFENYMTGIFLCLIWGQISAPSQLKNEQKLPKMVHIIPNFLYLHFGENFMKIQTKILKIQMHENLHINVNNQSYYGGQLKQQIQHVCYSFTLLFFMGFNLFKMAVQFF